MRKADGLLIVTPEYNFSIPGGLKNVIDWLSRGEDQPFACKPVAILTASAGPVGGARVQYDLRKVMLFVNAMTLIKPEVFVGSAASKFDAERPVHRRDHAQVRRRADGGVRAVDRGREADAGTGLTSVSRL